MPDQAPVAPARSRLKAVLFDVDGTLIDSNDAHAAAWVDAFAEQGHTVPFRTARSQIGKGGDHLVPALLPGATPEQVEALGDANTRIYLARYAAEVTAFPAICALFARLRSDGIRVVLATSAGKEEVDAALRVIGCTALIDRIVGADDVASSKPDPDIFAAALRKAGVSPDEAVVIGDTPYDMEAAAKAGVRALGLKCGGFPPHALEQAGAAALYHSPAALLADYGSWVGR